MKYRLDLAVANPLGVGNSWNVFTLVEDDASDELQARGVASSISGCNFLDAKKLGIRPMCKGYSKWVRVKMTNTTSYYLYLE